MIRQTQKNEQPLEPQTGRPAESGEGWLGRNRSGKRQLVGAVESAAPERAAAAGGGSGLAAEPCAIAGSDANPAGCGAGGTRPRNPPHRCHPGGGSTPDTTAGVSLAGDREPPHTFIMSTVQPFPKRSDEPSRIAGGKRMRHACPRRRNPPEGWKETYGVIVAYEDNMFKVKTDFGFVLVEKDKIAQIIPVHRNSEPSEGSTAATARGKDRA